MARVLNGEPTLGENSTHRRRSVQGSLVEASASVILLSRHHADPNRP